MKTLLTNAKVIDPVTETISDGEVMFEDGVIIPRERADETCKGLTLTSHGRSSSRQTVTAGTAGTTGRLQMSSHS